jgi:hypothetical protein
MESHRYVDPQMVIHAPYSVIEGATKVGVIKAS